jgi:ribonuclease G
MSKEIIINSDEEHTRIAIVENGQLAELYMESQEHERTIGNLFLGRIRRVMPSIQAAFVDIGQKQDAFLHFSDLIDNLPDWLRFVAESEPRIGTFEADYARQPVRKRRHHPRNSGDSSRNDSDSDEDLEFETEESSSGSRGSRTSSASQSRGKRHTAQHRHEKSKSGDRQSSSRNSSQSDDQAFDPTRILRRELPILVRISKEPIQSKGSRITTDLSLAGRFLVLVPMANYVAVSKKIMSYQERRRLRVLARSLVPEGFGVIVRTVAAGRNAKALDTDLRLLIEKWRKVERKLAEHKPIPTVIHQDVNMVSSIIRDLFTEDYDRILIDNTRLYRNIKGYIQAVAPQMADMVYQHESKKPIFEKAGIARSVEEAFQSRVELPSGGYLFIEQTEAMHVIDVNSGRAGRGLSQEDNSLKVNLEAAKVIARQVRLRDLGGIIVVDFIDMRSEKSRRRIHDQMRREFRKDRAVTKVLPVSDFGLIQITRQRLRPSVTKTFSLPEDSDSGENEKNNRRSQSSRRRDSSSAAVEPEDLVRKIEDWLAAFKEDGSRGPVKLVVHPFTAAYLNRKIPNLPTRWFLKFHFRVRVDGNPNMDPMSFRCYDPRTGKEIRSFQRKNRNPDKRRSGGGNNRRKQRDNSR